MFADGVAQTVIACHAAGYRWMSGIGTSTGHVNTDPLDRATVHRPAARHGGLDYKKEFWIAMIQQGE